MNTHPGYAVLLLAGFCVAVAIAAPVHLLVQAYVLVLTNGAVLLP